MRKKEIMVYSFFCSAHIQFKKQCQNVRPHDKNLFINLALEQKSLATPDIEEEGHAMYDVVYG